MAYKHWRGNFGNEEDALLVNKARSSPDIMTLTDVNSY